MWLVLGATVGLAALLDRHQQALSRTVLGTPMVCGGIRLQLPAHWLLEYTGSGMITATDSTTYPPHRSLDLTVAPPAEQGLMDQLLQKDEVGSSEPIKFGKQTGTVYSSTSRMDQDGEVGVLGRVVATAILPNGPEITLRLNDLGSDEGSLQMDDDTDLIRQIAATVQLAPDAPQPDQD